MKRAAGGMLGAKFYVQHLIRHPTIYSYLHYESLLNILPLL